ncbi:MAG TPA: hypothetical protein VN847_01915 [Streptosporangiaceae bacterium]|nr:hypothetical protein [Streptosporangiaceae bacterium]
MRFHSEEAPEQGTLPGNQLPGELPLGDHPHTYGKPRSWVFVGVTIAVFIAGGFAMVFDIWWLLWGCLGAIVLAVPVGKAVDIMGDSVLNGDPSQQAGQSGSVIEETGSATGRGVDLSLPPAAPRRGL